MNSLPEELLNRENLALETAKCLEDLIINNQKIKPLLKELLEANLTLTAYIKESQKRKKRLRLDLANEAKSTQTVVEILSYQSSNMSASPNSTYNSRSNKTKPEDNTSKYLELQQARSFISWFKHMIDNERSNLSLYLSDDAVLEWFGRTIKTRKKLSAFLKHDMQCTRHDFTTVENIDKVQLRSDRLQRKDDSILATPLHSPELVKNVRPGKRKLFHSKCDSPEWAEACRPSEVPSEKKLCKMDHENTLSIQFNGRKRLFSDNESEIHSKGDAVSKKRKCVNDIVTPPNREVGQGDCLPSTSGTDSDRSHDTLNAQLPKLAVECNGYIEFARSRKNNSIETMKWERKCKVQISYSVDPLNIGEYIIWILRYTDETKCRRNLLAAFEEAAMDRKLEGNNNLT